MGKRGRPSGYKLSEESKRAISESKRGQRHREETKDKISRSLLIFFRKKKPLSEEITKRYLNIEDDLVCDWLCEMVEEMDNYTDVLTERTIRNRGRIEISCGNNIELFSHNINPEVLALFKEHCVANGLNLDEALDSIL